MGCLVKIKPKLGHLHRNNNYRPSFLLVVILFTTLALHVEQQQQQVEATTFILGETCVIGMGAIRKLAANQLEEMGLTESMDIIGNFCRFMVKYSAEVMITEGIEVALRDLLRFVGRAGINLPNRLPGLAARINDLSSQIEASFEMDVTIQ